MKTRTLYLVLLSACSGPEVAYQYGLTWTCMSDEGCERAEEVGMIDRLNISGNFFFFHSRQDTSFGADGHRLASASSPAGCALLYGFSLFGHELEPSKVCPTAAGFNMEFSIPNANTATYSKWLVEARDLGPW